MTTQEKRWIDAAEVAQMVREALRAEFPGVKFSVRTKRYAGGSSVRVTWTDGPRRERVQAVCSLYQGASFDGMQDLMTYHDSILASDDGPELVHFGADFVTAERRISDTVREQMVAEVCDKIARWDVEPVNGQPHGERALYPLSARGGQLAVTDMERNTIHELAYQLAYARDFNL